MNEILEAALAYARRGWKVFPVRPADKRPLTAHGFKDASSDESVIRAWWEQWPDAGVAVATGLSGLIVIDVDAKTNGFASLEVLEEDLGPLPATRRAQTGGGGLHIFFKHPGNTLIRSRAGWLKGVDIRADGGYVVLPPSWHSSGAQYKWLNWEEVAELPSFLLKVLREPERPLSPSAPGAAASEDLVGEGGRNAYLTRVAGQLQRHGLARETLLLALQAENEAKCDPPLPDHEVAAVAASVGRYAPSAPLSADLPEPTVPTYTRASALAEAMFVYIKDKALVKGEPTGFGAGGLDRLLGGGKRLGEVTAWHAEAKTGKNTLWHKLMLLWLERGIPLAYASREITPASEVLPDLLTLKFKENVRLVDITPERVDAYTAAIESWPLYFAEGYGEYPLDKLTAWVDELSTLGVRYFWFDHLHYMLEDPEDHKAASKLIKEIKELAKTRSIHIDIIIQPNKLAEGQELGLNSIKGGSAMGQAIDNLLTLKRVKREGLKDVSELALRVARSKLARLGCVHLQYYHEATTVEEADGTRTQVAPLDFTEVDLETPDTDSPLEEPPTYFDRLKHRP